MALNGWLENLPVAAVDHRVMAAGMALADLHRMERPALRDEARTILERSGRDLPRLLSMAETVLRAVLTLTGVLLLLVRLHAFLPVVRVHGGAGGQGMSGIVRVVAASATQSAPAQTTQPAPTGRLPKTGPSRFLPFAARVVLILSAGRFRGCGAADVARRRPGLGVAAPLTGTDDEAASQQL
jgi:hypothetical protein